MTNLNFMTKSCEWGTNMYWNHRIIEHNDVEFYEAIHEVYYNEDGSIQGWTENPVSIMKYEEDSWEKIVEWIQSAFAKPVLVEKVDVEGNLVLVEREGE